MLKAKVVPSIGECFLITKMPRLTFKARKPSTFSNITRLFGAIRDGLGPRLAPNTTVLADEGKPASIKYFCLFNEFIRLLEASGFNEDFLKGDGDELGKLCEDSVDYRYRDERSKDMWSVVCM